MNNPRKSLEPSDYDSPLRIDTVPARPVISQEEKIERIRYHFGEIMIALGLDMSDESLANTPLRVAKMYVNETFSGLEDSTFPSISLFENSYGYDQMLIEKDIQVYSYCEHHFVPFIGKAHVAYFPSDKVVGLSKLNRIVKYFARRPQVQERLTMDIASSLKTLLQTEDVAVVIEAKHLCVASRGVEDSNSTTVTNHFSGRFRLNEHRHSFLAGITTNH